MATAPPLHAQGGEQGPVPVGVTEARAHQLRRSVRLTGSVEARRASVVASEVPGLVVELSVREGDEVSRGEPLAHLRRRNLELVLAARQADLKEAEARLALAVRNRERAEDLYASEVVSRQRLDDAVSEFTALTGRVESLKAEIARVEDDLERSTIRAPYDGVVVAEHAELGEWIGVGQPVVELVDLATLEVVLEVPERYFGGLEEGVAARITFEALPEVEVTGRLAAIIPRAHPEARTFPVKVRFPNPADRVGAGMLAQVDLPVGEPYRAVVVPKDAVVRRGERTVVYRVADGAAREVAVETGGGSGAWVEVRGPFEVGDRVVTRGNERLRDGQPIRPSPVSYESP